MSNRLPSVKLSVAAFTVGVVASYVTFRLDRYVEQTGGTAEAALWKAINYAGWFWTAVPIAVSALGLYYMARLSAPRTTWGVASRIFIYVGFTCHLFSWGNAALAPIASVATVVGIVVFLRQVVVIDIRVRNEKAPPAGQEKMLIGERILRALVADDSSPKTL